MSFTQNMEVGGLIKFAEEKRPYRIMAFNDRFVICSKSHPKSYMYTIIDFKKWIRGADIFWKWGGKFKYNNEVESAEAIKELQYSADEDSDLLTISRRNKVPLDIEWIKSKDRKKIY